MVTKDERGDVETRRNKVTTKLYKCLGCGREKKIKTNHFGECYSHCNVCITEGRWGSIWFCLNPIEERAVRLLEYEIKKTKG